MTNSEKYLKDGVVAKELWETFQAYYYKNKSKESDVEKAFRKFFEQEVKSTLTEDERVILRNLNKEIYTTIGFDRNGLYLHNDNVACCREYAFYDMFGNLFQFIKERRRIRDKRIVRR